MMRPVPVDGWAGARAAARLVAAAAAMALLPAGALSQPTPSDADVRFMRDMMTHHAQAVEMTALVAARTESADIRLLARRIAVSQEDELALMRRWLESRGAPVDAPIGGHGTREHEHGHERGHGTMGGGHAGMPGMLTPGQMARLAAAEGPDFDRLFLESMIFHHEGALVMVAELFATDGAAQETAIFQFASHVESDQRIEIERMRRMLDAGRQAAPFQ